MKLAVVLFNLGGPDSLDAVRPFLFNLFHDRAILAVPQPLRWLLAKLISARRAPVAREIYEQMGGRSSILPHTEQQARALELALQTPFPGARCFVAMRYWTPRAAETAAAVKAFAPDRIVLLPLYPQYSTTTTASSFRDWRRTAQAVGLRVPEAAICCYPDDPGFVADMADLTARALGKVPFGLPARVLFSAHGLPKRTVQRGDPYQWQVERTAQAIAARLSRPDLDWRVCYQSRVGPLEWIGPYTEDEVRKAGAEGRALVVAPIAFVSEHSETLVELDIEYRRLAEASGVPFYARVPAAATEAAFIDGLAALVQQALRRRGLSPGAAEPRICPKDFARCPCPEAAA